MKLKRLTGYFYIILLLSMHKAYSQAVESKNPPAKVTIDGKDKEWENSFFFSSSNHLVYAFSNDDKFLYLCIKANEEHMMRKILRFGFIIWLDTSGGHKEHEGIKYPMSLKERNIHLHDHGHSANLSVLLSNNNEMELIGFPALKEDGPGFVRVDAGFGMGIKPKINVDSLHSLVYELKIPFLLLYGKNGKQSGKELGIRLETGKIEEPKKPGGHGHAEAGSGVGPHMQTKIHDPHVTPDKTNDNFTGETNTDMKFVIKLN